MVSGFCAPALMDNSIINPKMVQVGEFRIKRFIFCHSSPRITRIAHESILNSAAKARNCKSCQRSCIWSQRPLLAPSRIDYRGRGSSELLRYIFVGIIRFFIFVRLLAIGQFHLLAPDFLIGNVAQEMSNDIETYTLLVVSVGNVPWRKMSIGGRKHFIARP